MNPLKSKKVIAFTGVSLLVLGGASMYAYAQNTPSATPTVAPVANTTPLVRPAPVTPTPTNPNLVQIVPINDNNNRVNINVSGKQEVDQDNLTMVMSYTIQNKDPKIVQDTLNREINAALTKARANQNAKALTVRTGQLSVYPHYEKQQLVNWVGQGTIVLEGTDFTLVSRTATEMNNMVISSTALGLTQEKINTLKDQTVRQAVVNFRQEAQKITELFGFRNYKIKEISVNYNAPMMPYSPRVAMMAKSADMAESVSIEPGKSTLEASVSGSIEMF